MIGGGDCESVAQPGKNFCGKYSWGGGVTANYEMASSHLLMNETCNHRNFIRSANSLYEEDNVSYFFSQKFEI